MTDKILSVPDVSAMIGRPPATLRWWRHMGEGPRSFKMGRSVVYKESDVQAWLDALYESSRGGDDNAV